MFSADRVRVFDSEAGYDRKPLHRLGYQEDGGAIHAIGSGELMLYGRGPEWMQVIGAPYSCPTMLSLVVPEGEKIRCESRRREGAGSWEHRFTDGIMIDAAPRAYGCVARHWELGSPLRMELDTHDFETADVKALFPDCAAAFLVQTKGTSAFYNDYPLIEPVYMLAAAVGGCCHETSPHGYYLTFRGEGALYVTGGKDYQKCFARMRELIAAEFTEILSEADRADAAFLKECASRRPLLREHPLAGRLENAVEDALLMIRAQQDTSGGIQAGHNYHMAYVRDQYGDSRGLLAMGAFSCARAILSFYRDIFEKRGIIANAQPMGVNSAFHVHENDLTELTGYLLLQATDYLSATGDREFFDSLIPMLDWALKAQADQLAGGMLPFNGDETYIAGHIVPRTIINHGSLEATMLFITGGGRYLDVKGGADDEMRRIIRETADRFDSNFRRGDTYTANVPARSDIAAEPEFRHGICLSCGRFGWLHRISKGAYVCAKCAPNAAIPEERREFRLKSALLMAPFIHSDALDRRVLEDNIRSFISEYEASGRLPSLPDGNRCLGYDFGLLLFAAASIGADADGLLEKTLELQDECGAWPEYFEGDVPRQTRCRPWESAINIAGAIEYLKERRDR